MRFYAQSSEKNAFQPPPHVLDNRLINCHRGGESYVSTSFPKERREETQMETHQQRKAQTSDKCATTGIWPLSKKKKKCNMSPKTSADPKPSCSQTTEKFAWGLALAKDVHRNVAQTVKQRFFFSLFFPPRSLPPQEKRQKRGEESHLTHRYASEGQEKCRNVR